MASSLRPSVLVLLGTGAAIALFHASWSAYWAAGGTVMADSLGTWAADWVQSAPITARIALWGIAVVKAAAGIIPLLVELRVVPLRRFWRAVGWAGGAGLVLYGGANTIVGAGVLTGFIVAEGVEVDALRAHVLLWDPAFALWGAALCAALALSRRTATPPIRIEEKAKWTS